MPGLRDLRGRLSQPGATLPSDQDEGNSTIDVQGGREMTGPKIALFCCANARAALSEP